MQPQLFGLHAPGQVGLQRPHGAAPAHAGAHAHARVQVSGAVGHGPCIHKQGVFPIGHVAAVGDGALPFHAGHAHVAATVELVVLRARTDAAVAVAPHGGVSTGQEQLCDRDFCAVTRQHGAHLGAHRNACGAGHAVVCLHPPCGEERLPAHQGAGERVAFGPQGHASAQFHGNAPAAGGCRVAVEIAARPAIVGAQRSAVGGGVQPLGAGGVVAQKVGAVDVLGAFAAPAQHLHAVDVVVARLLALCQGRCEPAPAVVVGQGRPARAQLLRILVERQLVHRAPAVRGPLVVAVVHRQARPAVGRQARTKHQLLQLGFAHLGNHGGCLRVGALGVQREEHRVVVAAVGQALLCIEHFCLVVHAASGQAGQAARAVGVIALAAAHLQRAKAVGRAGVVGHGQLGFVGVGIHFGAAAGNAGGGVAAHLQLAQPAAFRF